MENAEPPALEENPTVAQNRSHSSWCGWWVALTCTIWQHRNLLIFHEKPFHSSKVMEDALFLAWSWLKAREKGFNTSFNQWSSNISDSFG